MVSRELFIAFRRSTNMKPHRIIFYRFVYFCILENNMNMGFGFKSICLLILGFHWQRWCKWRTVLTSFILWGGCNQEGTLALVNVDIIILVIYVSINGQNLISMCPTDLSNWLGVCLSWRGLPASDYLCCGAKETSYPSFPHQCGHWSEWKHPSRLSILLSNLWIMKDQSSCEI